jgi:pyruvate dehydrogenase E1 component alpha subunit
MSGEKLHLDHQHLLHLLAQMVRIRVFERRCAELYQREKIRGFLHLYDGEEAIAVGVMETLAAQDAVVATYREHGQAIARGIPMTLLMAELYGKVEGCCRGRGGSLQFFASEQRLIGGNAIVGGGLPLAVGIALGDRMQGRDAVSACFFGEGAVDEGEFHESLNLAALWRLPVLFVCENNLYSMGTALARAESVTDIHAKASSYGVTSEVVDGNDIIAVEVAARRAVAALRAGSGPQFLECRTYRTRAHSMFDAQLYRDKAEVEAWKQRSPILRLQTWLENSHMVFDDEVVKLEAAAEAEVAAAIAFAEAGHFEALDDLERFVTMDEVPA